MKKLATFTTTVDEEILRKFKAVCVKYGKTNSEVLEQLMENWYTKPKIINNAYIPSYTDEDYENDYLEIMRKIHSRKEVKTT